MHSLVRKQLFDAPLDILGGFRFVTSVHSQSGRANRLERAHAEILMRCAAPFRTCYRQAHAELRLRFCAAALCQPGKVTRQAGLTACTACNAGQFSGNVTGGSICSDCPPGPSSYLPTPAFASPPSCSVGDPAAREACCLMLRVLACRHLVPTRCPLLRGLRPCTAPLRTQLRCCDADRLVLSVQGRFSDRSLPGVCLGCDAGRYAGSKR